MNEYLELRDEKVAELVKSGLTTMEIAEKLGLHRSAVNRSQIRTGLRIRQARPRLDYRDLDPKYVELHRRGYTDAGIGRQLGISKRSAQRIRGRLGLEPNYGFKHDRELVETMYREGASDKRIAEVMDTTSGQVAKIRSELRLVQIRQPAIPESRKLEVITMLEDGASYGEVARSTGLCQTSIQRNFPGQGWTREQVSEFASIRRLAERVGV